MAKCSKFSWGCPQNIVAHWHWGEIKFSSWGRFSFLPWENKMHYLSKLLHSRSGSIYSESLEPLGFSETCLFFFFRAVCCSFAFIFFPQRITQKDVLSQPTFRKYGSPFRGKLRRTARAGLPTQVCSSLLTCGRNICITFCVASATKWWVEGSCSVKNKTSQVWNKAADETLFTSAGGWGGWRLWSGAWGEGGGLPGRKKNRQWFPPLIPPTALYAIKT